MTKKANNVTTIASARKGTAATNPKGDAALANDAGHAERLRILSAMDTADDLLGAALVAGFVMTATYGPTSKAEVAEGYTRCNNPDVYASWFNRGDKAQAIIGRDATLDLIAKAEAGKGGSALVRIREALGQVIASAKTAGKKEFNKTESRRVVASALAAASEKVAAPKVVALRGAQGQRTATIAAAAAAVGAGGCHEVAIALRHMTEQAAKLTPPEGRETAFKEAMAALSEACDSWGVFVKTPKAKSA